MILQNYSNRLSEGAARRAAPPEELRARGAPETGREVALLALWALVAKLVVMAN